LTWMPANWSRAKADLILSLSLELSVRHPPKAFSFSVDGNPVALQDGSIRLPEGAHTVLVEHPDFFPLESDVDIPDNGSVAIEMSMQPRPVRLVPVIETNAPVRFVVDGQDVALSEEGFLPVPSFSSVEVKAVIRDHHDVIQRFEGRANEEIQWTVPLKPLPGPEFGENWSPPYFSFEMAWIAPRLV
jgi:hypothetical protein